MKSLTDNLNLNILDLLSVLLPGGLMMTLLHKFGLLPQFVALFDEELTWQNGFVSFGTAYFIGYVLYASSTFLDNCHDCLKLLAIPGKNVKNNCEKNKEGIVFTKKDVEWLARIILPYVHNTNNLSNRVDPLKVHYLGKDYEADEPIDAFQWSYRCLMNKHERMFSEVERYYSTARFFRSMTLVLFISAVLYFFYGNCLNGTIFMALCLISFILFLDRWQKTNHVAFKNVLILEALNKPKAEEQNA